MIKFVFINSHSDSIVRMDLGADVDLEVKQRPL